MLSDVLIWCHFWEPPFGGDLGVQMYNVEMAGAIVNLANFGILSVFQDGQC